MRHHVENINENNAFLQLPADVQVVIAAFLDHSAESIKATHHFLKRQLEKENDRSNRQNRLPLIMQALTRLKEDSKQSVARRALCKQYHRTMQQLPLHNPFLTKHKRKAFNDLNILVATIKATYTRRQPLPRELKRAILKMAILLPITLALLAYSAYQITQPPEERSDTLLVTTFLSTCVLALFLFADCLKCSHDFSHNNVKFKKACEVIGFLPLLRTWPQPRSDLEQTIINIGPSATPEEKEGNTSTAFATQSITQR